MLLGKVDVHDGDKEWHFFLPTFQPKKERYAKVGNTTIRSITSWQKPIFHLKRTKAPIQYLKQTLITRPFFSHDDDGESIFSYNLRIVAKF